MGEQTSLAERWALILGASSGFGAATALELARSGMHIFGVHLDLRATLPNAQRVAAQIQDLGREAVFFNVNAADAKKRALVLDAMRERLGEGAPPIAVFLHSLAFGTLGRYIPPDRGDAITQAQLEMTLDVMANSLVYWVQEMVYRHLLSQGSRVFAMTSAGSTRVWPSYGAVSAAKAALESHIRQLAFELAPSGVTVNGILAGVTDTPALRRIPGHEELSEWARSRNPSGRMTTPEDVARAIAALAGEGTTWITGDVIRVDGGENISG
ncbi:MAG: enoyl-ACP reductase [Dehalococcoidia bacterium]